MTFFRNSLSAAMWVLATGCHTWQPSISPTPGEAVGASGKTVRVIKTDGTMLEIDNAVFRTDSVIGNNGPSRIAVASDQIRQVDTRKLDGLRTAGLVVGGVLAAFGLYVALIIAALSSSGY